MVRPFLCTGKSTARIYRADENESSQSVTVSQSHTHQCLCELEMAESELVVLQYNVHVSNTGWDAEAKRHLASQVSKIMALRPRPPDVLCLQELFIKEMQAGYAAAFAAHGYSAHSALISNTRWCDSVRGATATPATSARVRFFPSAMLLALAAALLYNICCTPG